MVGLVVSGISTSISTSTNNKYWLVGLVVWLVGTSRRSGYWLVGLVVSGTSTSTSTSTSNKYCLELPEGQVIGWLVWLYLALVLVLVLVLVINIVWNFPKVRLLVGWFGCIWY